MAEKVILWVKSSKIKCYGACIYWKTQLEALLNYLKGIIFLKFRGFSLDLLNLVRKKFKKTDLWKSIPSKCFNFFYSQNKSILEFV